ncbi:unnamed protein product [Larinioides sclopetarius]|uniref:Uncharacterized protein n=1 Tax=Larinioides sclopetarius TaxID=280406 RepID=A0AAV2BLC9_9ARAC
MGPVNHNKSAGEHNQLFLHYPSTVVPSCNESGLRGSKNLYLAKFHVEANSTIDRKLIGMADYSDELLEELKKELPEDTNMEEFIQNINKLASEFVQNQRQKPTEVQLAILFLFLLIPVSLILYCFCRIMNSQKKRQGKDKKKQKEQKKETKKKA